MRQGRNIANAKSRYPRRTGLFSNSLSHRRISPEMCPSLLSTSDAAIERSVIRPSFQPIQATSRRSGPPRVRRMTSRVVSAAFATASMMTGIFGRPTARCFFG